MSDRLLLLSLRPHLHILTYSARRPLLTATLSWHTHKPSLSQLSVIDTVVTRFKSRSLADVVHGRMITDLDSDTAERIRFTSASLCFLLFFFFLMMIHGEVVTHVSLSVLSRHLQRGWLHHAQGSFVINLKCYSASGRAFVVQYDAGSVEVEMSC